MNRHEFISELKERLYKLPPEELQEALEYYEQYFEEAGADHEQEALAKLGTPAQAAAQIIGNFSIKAPERSQNSAKTGLSTLWLVVLAIFASPIALPLAVAAAAVALSLVIVLLSVLLSVGASGLAVLVAGAAGLIVSIPLLFYSAGNALFYGGAGLFCLGFGAALLIATVYISKKCFNWLAGWLGKFLLRRGAK